MHERTFTGKEEFYKGERELMCPNCECTVNSNVEYCPSCQYMPPKQRKIWETKRKLLYSKYYNLKFSQRIDTLKLLEAVEKFARIQVCERDMVMTGLDLASIINDSIIMDEPLCPICDHPMSMHVTQPMTLQKQGDVQIFQGHALVCKVADCKTNEGDQEMCFHAIPDSFIIEDEEEN